jgi:hypothetical protein
MTLEFLTQSNMQGRKHFLDGSLGDQHFHLSCFCLYTYPSEQQKSFQYCLFFAMKCQTFQNRKADEYL